MTEAWPWPEDQAIDKARRVAREYRSHLHRLDPGLCELVDRTMEDYGQRWVRAQNLGVDPDDFVTDDVCADYFSINPATVRKWWANGLLTERRRDPQSLRWLYRYSEVRDVAGRLRKRSATRGDDALAG